MRVAVRTRVYNFGNWHKNRIIFLTFFGHFNSHIDIYFKSMFHDYSPIHVCNGRLIYWYGTVCIYIYIYIKIPEKYILLSKILDIHVEYYIYISRWFIFATTLIF